VPETTIDLKEHLMLSWLPASDATASDILIISGTQNQTGTFSGAYGAAKDIEVDSGLPGSQPDGSAKLPVTLPATATKTWDLADAVADTFVLQFDSAGSNSEDFILGTQSAEGEWQPMVSENCVVKATFNAAFLTETPERAAGCEAEPLVGYDINYDGRWWAVLASDVTIALLDR